jgi:hypothetical protein
METVETLSLMLGSAWAAGINLYAAVFILGYLANTGAATLPPSLEVLSDPLVMTIAGFMYLVEFVADKTPGVDTGWDVLHTFIRIPAGAVLAAGMAEGFQVGPAAEFAALLAGGTLAAGSHFTKAGSRVLINSSPEPFSNWAASIVEDLAVLAGLWTALYHPVLFLLLLALFILLAAWLLPRLWRGIRRLFRAIGKYFGGRDGSESDSPMPPPQPTSRRERLKELYNDNERT